MTGFTFAETQYVHLVWLVLLLAITMVVVQLRRSNRLVRFLSSAMQVRLVRSISLRRRLTAIGFQALALLLLVVAMMRPQWGGQTIQADRVSSQVMICLDVSKSMLAEDVVPNRLDRAKAEVDALLGLLQDGQQVGLIAFAGKATVLCPQTTDFGFVRLILQEASPQSVGLGGTKIGDAIRTATDGFGDAGDINRLMLVITDGEDHDSFPLDAAAAAAEKGIRIVTVGFGDEGGSKIEITNPESGVRELLRDREGNPVVSRLDGATLREIALRTEGAYIPAGTGALDLESIYRAHIESMLTGVKSDGIITIRNEAYQWPLALAVFCWLLSVRLTAPRYLAPAMASSPATRARKAAASVLLLIGMCGAFLPSPSALAQATSVDKDSSKVRQTLQDDSSDNPVNEQGELEEGKSEQSTGNQKSIELVLDPRETYNLAVVSMADLDKAEDLLNSARGRAGVDGEVRFRALYNLGWIEAQRAEPLEQEEPKEALKHLNMAAGRFREAIRIRPESDEARRNLEVVSLRILAIEDQINRQDPSDLVSRLDELIQESDGLSADLMRLSQTEALYPDEKDRSEFRRLRGQQRILIGEISKLTRDAAREIERLGEQSESPDSATNQEDPKVQAAKLTAMMNYVEQSLPWANKSRSFARRLSAQPALLRWRSSADYLRRGREQMREPVERLSLLLADVGEHAQLVNVKSAAAENRLLVGDDSSAPEQPTAPAWLDQQFLSDAADSNQQRAAELAQLFAAIVDSLEQASDDQSTESGDATESNDATGANQPPTRSATETETGLPTEQELLQDKFRLAVPAVETASEAIGRVSAALGNEAYEEALLADGEAIKSLAEAAEYFYDVKRLIEATLADQQLILQQLNQLDQASSPVNTAASDGGVTGQDDGVTGDIAEDPESEIVELPPELIRQAIDFLDQRQAKNLVRLMRLRGEIMVEAQRDSQQAAAAAQAAPGDDSENAPNEAMQRAELAVQICDLVTTEMEALRLALQEPTNRSEAGTGIGETTEDSGSEASSTETLAGDDSEPSSDTEDESQTSKSETPIGADQGSESSTATPSRFQPAIVHGEKSVQLLKELQRLYFSLIEHLRDTAQRQQALNTETTSQVDENTLQPGPLGFRQAQLREFTSELAKRFADAGEEAQAAQQSGGSASPAPTTVPGTQNSPGVAQQLAQQQDAAKKFEKASQLIDQAAQSQTSASQVLSDWPADQPSEQAASATSDQAASAPAESREAGAPSKVGVDLPKEAADQGPDASKAKELPLELQRLQQDALDKLLEALSLFEPPQDQDQEDQDQDQNDDGNQGENEEQDQQQDDGGQDENDAADQQRNLTAEQILQAIRDAEAKRREERKGKAFGSGIVDKDW